MEEDIILKLMPTRWLLSLLVRERVLKCYPTIKSHVLSMRQVNPKGNQSWIFIWRTDAEAPILWPPDAKSQLIRKDPDAEEDWGQEEKGLTKDEMVGWHHWLNGHESEQALGAGEGQGGLACCSPWGCKKSDTTERLNSNNIVTKTIWCVSVTQSCPTLCNPMDCSLSASSVHGILQARILEWVAISFSKTIWY